MHRSSTSDLSRSHTLIGFLPASGITNKTIHLLVQAEGSPQLVGAADPIRCRSDYKDSYLGQRNRGVSTAMPNEESQRDGSYRVS